VTRKTVETHLGNVYRKLGITGRVRLVRALAEQAPGAATQGPKDQGPP
jgi:DNA-binding CsgD family transcriptional regulator